MSKRPSPIALRNAGGVPFLVLKGNFIVRNAQQPDGDTLAFAASASYDPGPIATNIPVDTTGNTSKNIRLQSTDAPEKAQPLGAMSRDGLLTTFGFDPAALGLSEDDFNANGGPVLTEGWVATHGMDSFERPLGYVFASDPGFDHNDVIPSNEILASLEQSGNFEQVRTGRSFPAFYENTDEAHAAVFASAARSARDKALGVWNVDATTTGFVPTKSDLGKNGQLIFPKFYRRVAEWPSPVPNADAFLTWLKQHPDGQKFVQGAHPDPVELWTLFEKVSDADVMVPYDVTRLWFSD